jgi:hypothetical protein
MVGGAPGDDVSSESWEYGGGAEETGVMLEPAAEPTDASDGDFSKQAERQSGDEGGMPAPAPERPSAERVAKAPAGPGTGARPGQPEPGRPIDKKPADGANPLDASTVTATDASVTTPPPPKPGEPPRGEQKLAGPLLIYEATIHLAVFEVAAAIDKTMALAKERGGYLVRREDRSIVVRVPAAAYREVLDSIGKLGDVLHRSENVEDVTDQFFDLQVRVRNARVVRERLEQLLAQAKSVEEALMVERELTRVTTEIERLEGRLKLLRELVAFSTITVEFRPRPTEQVGRGVRLPFGWLDSLGLPNLLSL